MNIENQISQILSSSDGLPIFYIILSLFMSLFCGWVISAVYRHMNKSLSYESSFQFTIIMVTIIISIIMLTIGSNIALSLGLIGSLSIIRFRAVIKSSADMSFLFWAISTGLAIGSQNYELAFVSILFISTVIILFNRFNILSHKNDNYILIIRLTTLDGNESNARELINNNFSKFNIKYELKSSFYDKNENISENTYSISKYNEKKDSVLLECLRDYKFVEHVTLLSPETNLNI